MYVQKQNVQMTQTGGLHAYSNLDFCPIKKNLPCGFFAPNPNFV